MKNKKKIPATQTERKIGKGKENTEDRKDELRGTKRQEKRYIVLFGQEKKYTDG